METSVLHDEMPRNWCRYSESTLESSEEDKSLDPLLAVNESCRPASLPAVANRSRPLMQRPNGVTNDAYQ